MNHLFIPSQESLELKELGFDEPCFGLFVRNKSLLVKEMPNQEECEEYFGGVLAPTFQQAFDFFEKKFNLYGQTDTYTEEFGNKQPKFGWEVRDYGEQWTGKSGFDTKREAELDCLRELISIAKEAPNHMFAFGYELPEERVFEVIKDIENYKKGDRIVVNFKDDSRHTFNSESLRLTDLFNKEYFKRLT